jgi:hypothetical protein
VGSTSGWRLLTTSTLLAAFGLMVCAPDAGS